MYLDKQLAIDLAQVTAISDQQLKDKLTHKSKLRNYVFYKKIEFAEEKPNRSGAVLVYLNTEDNKLLLCFKNRPESAVINNIPEGDLLPFEMLDKSVSVQRNVMVNQYIYTDYCSLRQELFRLIRWFSLSELIITGHGYSGAVGALFIFELGLSKPYLPVTSVLFGIPRVGNFGFTYAFNRSIQQLRTPLIRITNQKDWLTYLPFDENGYRHIGKTLELCFFHKKANKENIEYMKASHNMLNYYVAILAYFEVKDPILLNGLQNKNVEICNQVRYNLDEHVKSQIRKMDWYDYNSKIIE